MTTITGRFLMRQGTLVQWTLANPILSLGEFGLETDNQRIYVGDGVTAFNDFVDFLPSALGVITILAGQTGVSIQAYSARLDDIAALTPTLDNVIVGDGSNWIQAGPVALATALGLGDMAYQSKDSVNIDGGTAILDVATITQLTPTSINGAKINGGVNAGQSNDGPISSGTYTFELGDANFRRFQNAGNFTLAPGASDNLSMVVRMDNDASAGTVTLGAFTKVTGDAFTTDSSDSFMLYYTQVGTFSHLHVVALQ